MFKITKNLRLLRYAIMIVRDPSRLENILTLSADLHEPKEAEELVKFYQSQPRTAQALIDQPHFSFHQPDMNLGSPGSLGHSYVDFLTTNGLNPRALDVKVDDRADAYILTHMYETHDLWHVLTGFDTTVAGELGLQAFYAAQNPSRFPIALLALGLLNTLLFARNDYKPRLDAITNGWTMGKKAKALFGIAWSNHLHRPLIDIRQELGIAAA